MVLIDPRCYVTTACIKHYKEDFDDSCYELERIRWFRDTFVIKSDKDHYYETAPLIIDTIESLPNNEEIYEYIYNNYLLKIIDDINENNYASAYVRYENMMKILEEELVRPILEQRLVKVLKKQVKNT